MRVTRRGWGVTLIGIFLIALALLLQEVHFLLGAAVLGAWLLGAAALFVHQQTKMLDSLTIEQRTERDRVVTDRELAVTLEVTAANPSPLDLAIESRPPPSTVTADSAAQNLRLETDQHRAETTYLAAWPHAGTVTFEPPVITTNDRLGLFESTYAMGPAPSVTVATPGPREIHVGVGGEPLASGYGEHETGRTGSGLEPAQLREYVPGDAATRIDWKTTARLAEPYVREYEVETDRRTVLIVDHNETLGIGSVGETELDYVREVALAHVASASALDDPLGCYTVGDAGVTGRWRPAADRHQYEEIERHLANLAPTEHTTRSPAETDTTPAEARTHATRLLSDQHPFASTLRPYFEARQPYVKRLEREPLYRVVRTARETLQGALWTVLLTNDENPAAVHQAVSTASRGEGRVILYLTPSILFEPGGLGDLDTAYERYVEFEEFRRELARHDNVTVYEVAPGDRLEAVLSVGRRRRPSPSTRGSEA